MLSSLLALNYGRPVKTSPPYGDDIKNVIWRCPRKSIDDLLNNYWRPSEHLLTTYWTSIDELLNVYSRPPKCFLSVFEGQTFRGSLVCKISVKCPSLSTEYVLKIFHSDGLQTLKRLPAGFLSAKVLLNISCPQKTFCRNKTFTRISVCRRPLESLLTFKGYFV